jgi:hypothetical protein
MGNVPTKTCKSCRTEIHNKAKRCPNCRSDQRSWPARHKILTGLGVVVVVVLISTTMHGSSASQAPAATSAPGTTAAPTAVPTAVSVLKVSSLTLAQQFDANKVRALGTKTGSCRPAVSPPMSRTLWARTM